MAAPLSSTSYFLTKKKKENFLRVVIDGLWNEGIEPVAPWRRLSSGLLRRVVWKFTDVSEVLAIALMMEALHYTATLHGAITQKTSTRLHGATTQKTAIFVITAMRTSNLTRNPFSPNTVQQATDYRLFQDCSWQFCISLGLLDTMSELCPSNKPQLQSVLSGLVLATNEPSDSCYVLPPRILG
jgi:hypothetical protein